MQSQQLRVVQTNTKERIVRITERTTISMTKVEEVKRGATIKKKKKKKEEEEEEE